MRSIRSLKCLTTMRRALSRTTSGLRPIRVQSAPEPLDELPTKAELVVELGCLDGSVETSDGRTTRAWIDHEPIDPASFDRASSRAIAALERQGDPYSKGRVRAWRTTRARARWAFSMRSALKRVVRVAAPRTSAQRRPRARRRGHQSITRARGPDPEPPAKPPPALGPAADRGRS